MVAVASDPIENSLRKVAGVFVAELADVDGGVSVDVEVERPLEVDGGLVCRNEKKGIVETTRRTMVPDGLVKRRKGRGRLQFAHDEQNHVWAGWKLKEREESRGPVEGRLKCTM